MVRCPKCKGVNTKNIDGLFYCDSCFNGWSPDPKAGSLYAEWSELDKSNRLVAQIVKPGSKYHVQYLDADKLLRRTEVAQALKNNHQHDLDLAPEVWYKIFQDAN